MLIQTYQIHIFKHCVFFVILSLILREGLSKAVIIGFSTSEKNMLCPCGLTDASGCIQVSNSGLESVLDG